MKTSEYTIDVYSDENGKVFSFAVVDMCCRKRALDVGSRMYPQYAEKGYVMVAYQKSDSG